MFAHELGHTLFYDRTVDPPRRTYGEDHKGEEGFCSYFAGAILMPRPWMLRPNRQVSLESLIDIADKHGLPVLAAARRLILDLKVLDATFIKVAKAAVTSWQSTRRSNTSFPKRSLQIVSSARQSPLTEEQIRLHPVINRVVSTGAYCNSEQLPSNDQTTAFVEGIKLRHVAPRGACVFLLHPQKPSFVENSLFRT